MIELVVAGAAGRMGGRIIALARESPDLRVVAAFERPEHPAVGRDAGEVAGGGPLGVLIGADPVPVLARGRVLVEFTTPEASLEHLRIAADRGARAVIGTTGLKSAQLDEIKALAGRTAVLLSPNMSVGVNLAFRLLALMARTLGDEYDVEITEIHHRMKKDAPSGTAQKMAEVIADALGRNLDEVGMYGRHGIVGERGAKEIGVHALRGGDIAGEHTVVFSTLGERLELTHRAHSRDTFARGALRAIRFIAAAAPGLYSMHDVLML
ncbi:MAG TPA: 4-hydroxy-tetrahydrodipicolinate reductase [Methylomirabilota bacterium]|jgi:4-hydroxy-tetrahydrodipicolinate reductase|nr:4-hydroxy-tetrahydrodipicolinate reductase [Methylomirabilota bacterium]